MNIANEDVQKIIMAVPEGHRHLRTILSLKDGTELTLLEATVAAIVRAYTTIKTHPEKNGIVMQGRRLSEKKTDFAEWQLLEVEDENF